MAQLLLCLIIRRKINLPRQKSSSVKNPLSIFTQELGTTSEKSAFIFGVNQISGAITVFCLFGLSHAPHQLKELFEIILCLHLLIRNRSSYWPDVFTDTQFALSWKFSFTHSGSSENMKNFGLFVRAAMYSAALKKYPRLHTLKRFFSLRFLT